MNEIDDLLERIETPVVDTAADVARGDRALRRRRRYQVSGTVVSVVAVAALLAAAQGAGGPGSAGAGFDGRPGAGSSTSVAQMKHQLAKAQHAEAQHSNAAKAQRDRAHGHLLAVKKRMRQLQSQMRSMSTDKTLQSYHDILAAHLDPTGDKLRLAQNEQSGSDSFGTKLDWNGGGMLEIVVGRSWAAAGGFSNLESAHMTDTTFQGEPARVSTAGDDQVVSVRHADGTVVTLIASTSFGNNGTSTSNLGLTQHQLLEAAADPKLQLPPNLR